MRNYIQYIDGLVQERRNSIANVLELRLSCTNLLIYDILFLASRSTTLQNLKTLSTTCTKNKYENSTNKQCYMCVKQTSTSEAQFPYDFNGLVQWSYVLHYAIDFSIVIFSGNLILLLSKLK